MEKALLLERLNGLVSRYRQHRNYIEKAKVQSASGKFNPAVIEKVILDHEIKASDVADEVGPLLPMLSTLIDALVGEKAEVHASNVGVDEQVQELELRAAIGELSDDEFNTEVADLRARLDTAAARVGAIDAELGELEGGLSVWADLATPHGHYVAPAPVVVAQPATAAPGAGGQPAAEPAAEPAGEPEPEPEPSGAEEHIQKGIREDLGDMFPSGSASIAIGDDIAIETAESSEGEEDGLSEEVSFGAEDSSGVSASEVELDLGGDAPLATQPVKEAAKEDDSPRRALLLYQEGTAEEQIYPFTNDALTIGRGRENDIQIKNDSKVSRYHCKLQRRGNNFYIEDAKSSNGTLVNGELITDRRLFGGEEIIIGETFFRFRIME